MYFTYDSIFKTVYFWIFLGAGEVIPPNSDLIFEVTLESLKSKKVKIEVLDAKNCTKDARTRNNDILVFDYIGYFEDGKLLLLNPYINLFFREINFVSLQAKNLIPLKMKAANH